jgi:hypothetical protein
MISFLGTCAHLRVCDLNRPFVECAADPDRVPGPRGANRGKWAVFVLFPMNGIKHFVSGR